MRAAGRESLKRGCVCIWDVLHGPRGSRAGSELLRTALPEAPLGLGAQGLKTSLFSKLGRLRISGWSFSGYKQW